MRFWYDTITILQEQEHYINLQMDLLGNPLTTHQIQMNWEISIEPYPNSGFSSIVNPDRQSGNGLGSTRSLTRSDGPEPLLTLV